MADNFIGIVLRRFKYSDTLEITDIYTESMGCLSFLVPIHKSPRRRGANLLFQPLSLLEFKSVISKNGKMSRLSEVKSYFPFSSLPYNPFKSAIALYLSEFLSRALKNEEHNPALFSFIEHSLMWLDVVEDGYANFHLYFLLHLSAFLGISPNTQEYAESCFFDLVAGCFVTSKPLHPHFITPADTPYFISLLNLNIDSISTLKINGKTRGEYLVLIELYYRLHIPDFPELKSTAVLRELFD